MTRKIKKQVEPSTPQVDAQEMMFAIQVFQAGLRVRMPMPSPEKKGHCGK